MGELNKFIYIKNILSSSEVDLLWNYAKIFHRNNSNNFDTEQTQLGETRCYGSEITDALLLTKQKIIEDKLNTQLLPAYTYWRIYTKFSSLLPHTDRASCEYTVSITVSQDKTWPLFIDGEEVIIQKGDGILYQGSKFKHWRNEYDGDHAFQIFLHYVKKDGEFKNFVYDKRNYLGQHEV